MADEMDFSEMDGMDDIDWSDVESELQQNKEMIQAAATGGGDAPSDSGGGGTDDAALELDGDVGMEFLMKIPLKLEVEVGMATILIKELLAINAGSVFELKKRLGDPMDIKIHNKLVAQGEIIIQNEKFGIKITKILDKEKRLASLKL
ncbi:MAG: flagellar motor switch protein FliN [SAR324 cluster bacterium]|nr:flagellar motor switch protein FliN [SAR324 cluster bacterium]